MCSRHCCEELYSVGRHHHAQLYSVHVVDTTVRNILHVDTTMRNVIAYVQ